MSYTLGIDVSHNNGVINWSALKGTGKAQFAVIRICHGLTIDRQFTANLFACKAYKIPYAFYWYAESATVAGAQAEAKFALSKIAGSSPLFVAYDAECVALSALGKNDTTDVAWAACEAIKNAGYASWIYTNENWRKNEIDIQYLKNKGVKFWYARYTGQTPNNANYSSMCGIWQYSCTGKLSGNASQYIDLDICYDTGINSKILASTAKADYIDTTVLKTSVGKTYQFKSGAPLTAANGDTYLKKISETHTDGFYYTKYQAIKRGTIGVYMRGIRRCVATIQ